MTDCEPAQVWAALQEPGDLRTIDGGEVGVLLTLKEFVEWVSCGAITDYDGVGHWATETRYSDTLLVYPTSLATKGRKGVRPAWATHVFWFNR